MTAEQRDADFDQLSAFVLDRYPYLSQKATDWEAVRARYRPLAAGASDIRTFVAVLESTLDELYDPHTHLGVNLATSWRLPPYDIWAEWRHGRAVIAEVRRGSGAEAAGARPGMEVLEVDGLPLARALEARRPHCLRRADPEVDEWALRSLLAGRHDRARDLVVAEPGRARRRLHIEPSANDGGGQDVVTSRSLPGFVGYIRIASFGDDSAVEAFDRALEALRSSRALILDVRDNPGGDTEVARPIMGRLIRARRPYAWMAHREGVALGPRWAEYVEPRGPWTFDGRIVVLVNHWSESMAEGFAMGLDGIGRATVVGTRMAGLGAGIARTTLENSKIDVQISAEPVYHVDGSPRTAFRPRVAVDLTATPQGSDPILEAALRHLRRGRRR